MEGSRSKDQDGSWAERNLDDETIGRSLPRVDRSSWRRISERSSRQARFDFSKGELNVSECLRDVKEREVKSGLR